MPITPGGVYSQQQQGRVVDITPPAYVQLQEATAWKSSKYGIGTQNKS
jgi:hypothetical protein